MNGYVIAAVLSGSINLVGGIFYLYDVWRGGTTPHFYTWFVWFLVCVLGGAVALWEGAYASGALFAVSALINITTAYIGWRKGKVTPTPRDKIALACALAVIPLWVATQAALVAAILISLIDIFGCYPTLRKGWALPFEENVPVFLAYIVAGVFAFLAISPLTLAAAFYPITIVLLDTTIVTMLVSRRMYLRRQQKKGGRS